VATSDPMREEMVAHGLVYTVLWVALGYMAVARGIPPGLSDEGGFMMADRTETYEAFGAGLESQGKLSNEPGLDPSPT